ncbi:MAG: hydrogenase maturation protease [Pseudonocardiales bacterium]|nr:hydrogenase maturation protease [Pseudonocardiales bacterium]
MADAARVLVAGIGNIFLRDDGFGPAVVAELLRDPEPPPEGVRIVDYGIRGMHLAYDLLDPIAALVLVDAVAGRTPGTVTVLEVGPEDVGRSGSHGALDAHGMEPVAVLAGLESLGGSLPPTYVVGCVPADVSEGMGLTAAVAAAVPLAAERARGLAVELAMAGAR